MLSQDVVCRLREYFASEVEVAYAALFGSIVSKGFSHHDIDLAIKVSSACEDKYAVILNVVDAVSRVLGVDPDVLDIVDLDRAGLEVKRRVALEGLILVDRGYLREMLMELISAYPEYSEYKSLSISEWLHAGDPSSIDFSIVKSRMDFAKNEASFLEEYVLSKSRVEVEASPVLRRLLERGFQIIVEAAIDICRHIVSAKGWGGAFTVISFIEECGKRGVVSREVGEELMRMVKLRNIIIHRYLEVDYSKLYDEAGELIGYIRELEKQLTEFLRREASRNT